MNDSVRVSVVIPCFNHGEFLPEAVGSVANMKREDIELIVVDDGSTDERTRKEMDGLSARGIKVIRQENKGLAGARNAGVLASQGEYIFPLDADDRLRAGWVNRGISILGSDPKVGVVYGDAECFGIRTGRWQVGPFDADRLMDDELHPLLGPLPPFCLGTEWRIRRYDARSRIGRLGFLARCFGARVAVCICP